MIMLNKIIVLKFLENCELFACVCILKKPGNQKKKKKS